MFKTIKSRVIFVIVFCLICIAITTGAIIYKNIEIDETEGAKKEEARLQEDTELQLDIHTIIMLQQCIQKIR